jgi:hypothetical protein
LEFYFLIYPFQDCDLKDFAYYFADKNVMSEYFKNMTEWMHRLQVAVGQWQIRWNEQTQGVPPRLYFKGNSGIVYDSRSGSVVEHSIGELAHAVLNYLSRPVRMEEVVNVFSPQHGSDVLNSIALLESKGLLFQEGDRLLSLVLRGDHGSGAKEGTVEQVQAENAGGFVTSSTIAGPMAS